MRVFLKPLAIVCALTVLTPITSQAALFEDDEARLAILDLRQQVTGFQNAIIQLQNQLDESRRENSQLRGSNELLEKRIQELVAQQKSFYKDINSRLKNLEPQQLEIEGVQGKVQPGEKEAYQEALNAFQDGNLKKSDTAFEEFVKKYPDSPYWPLAQFWLGNSNYAQKDYKGAILALQAMIKRYPLHARIPDALLTLANSQIESGQKAAGKKTLEQLLEKHSDSEAAGHVKQALKRLK